MCLEYRAGGKEYVGDKSEEVECPSGSFQFQETQTYSSSLPQTDVILV